MDSDESGDHTLSDVGRSTRTSSPAIKEVQVVLTDCLRSPSGLSGSSILDTSASQKVKKVSTTFPQVFKKNLPPLVFGGAPKMIFTLGE